MKDFHEKTFWGTELSTPVINNEHTYVCVVFQMHCNSKHSFISQEDWTIKRRQWAQFCLKEKKIVLHFVMRKKESFKRFHVIFELSTQWTKGVCE